MSEEEPEAYRPRRAWREQPDPTAPDPTSADPTGPDATAPDLTSPDPTNPAVPGVPDADLDQPPAQPSAATPVDLDEDDAPRPLYRDESDPGRSAGSGSGLGSAESTTSESSTGAGSPSSGSTSSESPSSESPSSESPGASAGPTADLSDETTILSRARQHKRSQTQHDPDETTLLPRTAAGARVRHREADELDDDDDLEDDPASDRRRLLLLIGAVAVVAVLGLLAGYAILKTTSQPVAAPGPTSSATEPGTPSDDPSSADATALITDQMMLSPAQAETLDSKRTWKVALDQRGTSSDSENHPACLSSDTTEGAPVPQQTVLRLLSSSGADSPAALHQATAYATPEEAAQAYAYASRTLGDCAMTGAWIAAGHQVSGVGDQAVGVTLQVLGGDAEEFRTVVLTRTGRVVDVIDVAKPGKAVTAKRVTEVAGDVVDTQCQAAGGACSDEPESADAPPPLGGDQPGFLASGDLPPMGAELTRWAGTTPGEPDADLLRGSGCETVNWSKVDAEDRSHRTYLLADSSSRFGLDEVIITTADEASATKLAEKVRDAWKDCSKRQLTATVADLAAVSGPGAKSTDVTGWTTEVSQKADDKTSKYRVGIVSAGTKVAFVFLNPQDDLDLTDDQFDTVAVRAGQRATQVS